MEPCQGFEELVLLKAASLQSGTLPLDPGAIQGDFLGLNEPSHTHTHTYCFGE